ncbi:alpha-hydroxy-acid oxidizing protein [Nocardioides albus]|uniref:L-lactate dehydrogenase (Cytochrome)/lactate 2-monooxygenase n=1 Tax=Nocardioides albus TaxID=1841 RepID=A0A7W5A1P7_9ACTN|nr:alpha-hydroxy-acid oxidizing protein [Nocardioides albus]MBB3088048.1 L-lactate dehydrogenase (cytochrome)/lactate 2-monooxygenase [Nocardioides albus]GGU22235.1 alpha-hydroxy-acid oxidizing enzyme [Nocardioides albus]
MSIGRDLQSAIFRKGLFGHRPVVPTEPAALAEAAQRAMSKEAWAYVDGGAGQQRTVAANTAAFDHFRLVPRMLANVESRDLRTTLFGVDMPAPLMLGPVGVLELAHPRAEHEVAAAARATGIPMVISTQASVPMEEVAKDLGDTPRLYQLYWSKDETIVESFVRRAEAIGSDALVVTLDTHMLGWRTRDLDLGYLPFARGLGIAQYTSDPAFRALVEQRLSGGSGTSVRPGLREIPSALTAVASMAQHHPGKLVDNLRSGHARAAVETFLDVFSRSDLIWDDLDRLREMTDMPIVLKGLQAPEDARRALEHGVDGIIVSNHGGRQVDGAIASIDALPSIVDEVDGRIPVLFDSGIRSGADILKALALGADAVLLGRPYVYGLALAGAAGVQAVLEHMIAELDLSLGLVGCRSVEEIGRELLG